MQVGTITKTTKDDEAGEICYAEKPQCQANAMSLTGADKMILCRDAVVMIAPLCSVVVCLHAIGVSLCRRLLVIGFKL